MGDDTYSVCYIGPDGEPVQEEAPKVTMYERRTTLHYEDGSRRVIPLRHVRFIDCPPHLEDDD